MTSRAYLTFIAPIACAAACASHSSDPAPAMPSWLYGEVHVHEFSGGVHPGALFVAHPIAADKTSGDELFPSATTLQSKSCSLLLSASTTAVEPTPPAPVMADAGLVRIKGGAGISEVDLLAHPPDRSYLPASLLPPGEPIFTGGEMLQFSGSGASAPAFAGALAAPRPLTLERPETPTLSDGEALVITWLPDHAARVSATLVASTTDGRWALVECDAADEDGELALPAELLAQVPAAPRDLQLEVSRDQLGVALGPPDSGVLIHAGYSVTLRAHQP
jgi:hypothetical protein